MTKKFEMYRFGIVGEGPISMDASIKARHEFIKQYIVEPTEIRLSPSSLGDLKAVAKGVTFTVIDSFLGMEVKVDEELKGHEWYLCSEDAKVFTV